VAPKGRQELGGSLLAGPSVLPLWEGATRFNAGPRAELRASACDIVWWRALPPRKARSGMGPPGANARTALCAQAHTTKRLPGAHARVGTDWARARRSCKARPESSPGSPHAPPRAAPMGGHPASTHTRSRRTS
jgi:hypothetical protein